MNDIPSRPRTSRRRERVSAPEARAPEGLAAAPSELTIRSYRVGFGDCFLLTFHYADRDRYVLIDFGSTRLGTDAPDNVMKEIATDIARETKQRLTAIVVTHRHADHISGFDPGKKGDGPGAIIRNLKPELVVQPWTEDPALPTDATAPASDDQRFSLRLEAMHSVAEALRDELKCMRSGLPRELSDELAFLGEDNLKNHAAVVNLQKMGKNEYVRAGSRTALTELLPGVNVTVLGPPTLEQWPAIKRQRSRDENEFWMLQAAAGRTVDAGPRSPAAPIFPDDDAMPAAEAPIEARWLLHRLQRIRAEQMLSLVRILDAAMNNTSLVLLFETGGKSFLFAGDAQIENWSYALSQDEIREKLRRVDMYKVGHHGSRNATPKTLWELFDKKRKKARADESPADGSMTTMISTLPDVHGEESRNTEVPRRTLVRALRRYTNYVTTERIQDGKLYVEQTFRLS